MSEKKVVSSNSMPCPVNSERLLTVIVWDNGDIDKSCSAGRYDGCNSRYQIGCPVRS